ncbi:MAG: alpha/beta hydrolase [Proteobacteria bacterium]|nr:alpha/beta hydrolase [Pseudomonadota bacterium]
MNIDYEAEYNARARVPDHPRIFERWKREAASYRALLSGRRRAELGLRYGDSDRQIIDLLHPEGGARGALAMFIHGGYWRSLEPSTFSHMAAGLNAHGVSVAVAGYDLCPQVTVAQIIEQTARACLYLWRRFGQRMLVCGHSAGGHLAACMLATDWSRRDPGAPADLVPTAIAISGIFDLAPLLEISMNADLRLDAESARANSPLFWPPPVGKMLDAIVGAEESNEFLRQSRGIAQAWGKEGVATRCEAVAERNHFTVIDALADPRSAMVDRHVALARLCQNQ